MPFSRARSATALPTAAAASLLPVYFSCSAIAFSTTAAAATRFRTVRCNYLCVNVTRGTMYHQASCAQLLELAACAGRTTDTSRFLIHKVAATLSASSGYARLRRRNEHPCLYKAQDDGRRADPLQPGRSPAYQRLSARFQSESDIQQ